MTFHLKDLKAFPAAWHGLIPAGKIDGSGRFLTVDRALAAEFDELPPEVEPPAPKAEPPAFHLPPNVAVISAAPEPTREPRDRSPLGIVAAENFCDVCEWNDKNMREGGEWLCQHLGCAVCTQRGIGGLKGKIRRAGESCPLGKWLSEVDSPADQE